MSAGLFLGIDGGQSSTEAVVGDAAGRVLGRGIAGPCNHISGPEAIQRFENAIGSAVRQACEEAGAAPLFQSACLGLSGGPEDKAEHIRRVVRADRYKITHDAEIALAGALEGQPGVVVIAGTGSMAFGRNARCETARAGGWGYLFGDEGGAWDIARRAVRAALAMEEGWGPDTALRSRLLEETQSASANAMLHRFYTPAFPRSRVASLAKLVDEAASEGDAVARMILADAASALAYYGKGVCAYLFPAGPVNLSFIGGVFESEYLRRCFTDEIERNPGCTVHPPKRSASEGALLEAIRLS